MKDPKPFAPGVASTHHHEHSAPTFNPAHTEMLWSRWPRPEQPSAPQVIMVARCQQGGWSGAEVAAFSGKYNDGGPCFSADGTQLFFYSRRPLPGGEIPEGQVIWKVDRTPQGWANLAPLTSLKRGRVSACPSVAANGNLYFCGSMAGVGGEMGIFVSEYLNGQYSEPKLLPPQINSKHHDWTPAIAPDESYLLFSSNRPGSVGDFDLYISFWEGGSVWSDPINLGPSINTAGSERFPGISRDGRYLFFTRDSDLMWASRHHLEVLPKKEKKMGEVIS